MPNKAKMHMNKNRSSKREAMAWIELVSDVTKLDRDLQYLEIQCAGNSGMCEVTEARATRLLWRTAVFKTRPVVQEQSAARDTRSSPRWPTPRCFYVSRG
jgi:hypothetical protein